MPGGMPRSDSALLAWGLNLTTRVSADPVPLGITAPRATAFAALYASFATAMAACDPGVRSKARTTGKNTAREAFKDDARWIMKSIYATPTVSDETLEELGLNVRGTPTIKPPPGKPERFVATVDETGAVQLGWKCPNPPGTAGTIYQVWRRTSPTGEFAYLGGNGAKRFLDQTIPAGASQVTYQIQAVRSTAVGAWAQFNLNFGVSNAGTVTAKVTELPAAKLAA